MPSRGLTGCCIAICCHLVMFAGAVCIVGATLDKAPDSMLYLGIVLSVVGGAGLTGAGDLFGKEWFG